MSRILILTCISIVFHSFLLQAAVEKPQPNIVVQILGAPGSGKTEALGQIINSLSDKKLKEKLNNIKKVDLDVERENIAVLPGNTQLFIMFKALNFFQEIVHTSSWVRYHVDKIIEIINNNLKKLYQKHGIEFYYDTDKNNLIINSKIVNERNFGDISRAISKQSDIVFKQLGHWDLLTHLNRYTQLQNIMESMYVPKDLGLDEVGAFAEPIVERLSKLRNARYETMILLIHPRSVGVNLLLNALRTSKGQHFADPDYIYKQYYILQKMIANKTDYFPRAESVLILEDKEKISELENEINKMNIEDNDTPENSNKALDLLVIVNILNFNNLLESIGSDQKNTNLRRETFAIFQASLDLIRQKIPESQPEMDMLEKELKEAKIWLTHQEVSRIIKKLAQEHIYIRKSDLLQLMNTAIKQKH